MNIAIGCDDAAVKLKEELVNHLVSLGHDYTDYSDAINDESNLYPDIAERTARAVAENKHDRGIIVCGTGIGVSIVANKVPGIRAALCHDVFSAVRARKSNGAQIITMGERVIGVELAKTILEHWLAADDVDPSSQPKVQRIMDIEEKLLNQEGEEYASA
ncbi:ribose-5-phosphate isomerase [Vibrio breoganii]|uniref:RpiB/LacA/LacB family sugar-phosphate isomerase n=1 Tax=Vibrio breoganii TaxID=553239 RepID=UPI000C822B97|nr:RpiB/LacA/LacB family sugar-phosphate isomerase [Vibrio breoganii]PMF98860.1 ribose-5-phosphate isomerase [Vibrio breoganii]PMG32322.1 ribose-5-phosphate isomerase [Vibrio breoganii]PMG82414.1 ribose-5-phosphate isomerase [Vibrio breoganii]PMG92152.1 ribose-5-phosphate isomerase [Vibrio breoganii]PMK17129.1 ribose-5-phosphate isomerase [Vibrio breoganii]